MCDYSGPGTIAPPTNLLDAAQAWNATAVRSFLKSGVDPNLRNSTTNETALHRAIRAFTLYYRPCKESYTETVLALLEGGE